MEGEQCTLGKQVGYLSQDEGCTNSLVLNPELYCCNYLFIRFVNMISNFLVPNLINFVSFFENWFL